MSEGTFKKNTVMFLRLSTGEDIIAECLDDDIDPYRLSYPFKIVYTVSQQHGNALTVSLIEWVFPSITEDQVFTVSKETVLTRATPSKILEEYYQSVVEKLKNNERYKVMYPNTQKRSNTPTDLDEISPEEMELIEQMIKRSLEQSRETDVEPDTDKPAKPPRKRRIN